jgi:molecular chaperone GrpE
MASSPDERDFAPDEMDTESTAPSDVEPTETAPEPSPEDMLRRERDDYQDRWLRLVAEMDNLRKRTRREVEDARRFGLAGVIRPLLEVHDNFDRALLAAADTAAGADGDAALASLRTGVEMVAQSLWQALVDQGVREIAAEGRDFDPRVHEAVAQQPAPAGVASGVVLQVVQKGYILDELVLRPARVIVAQ